MYVFKERGLIEREVYVLKERGLIKSEGYVLKERGMGWVQTLRGIGRAFDRDRILGVREEPRIREQDFGNFQVASHPLP